MTEIWKDIPGYEGHYQVSDHGRVRALERLVEQRNRWGSTHSRLMPQKELSPAPNKAGYLHVSLYNAGIERTFLVHRLVAGSFIPNPTGLNTVNHINGTKDDNKAVNLEWLSQKDNNQHARVELEYRQHRHGVIATKEDGTVLCFPSKLAAEKELCGRPTGIISWAMKQGKPALGMTWKLA